MILCGVDPLRGRPRPATRVRPAPGRHALDGLRAPPWGRIRARGWTTNGWSAHTKVEDVAKFRTHRDQAYPQRHFPAGTRPCAEGFRGEESVGLPCATITA